MAYCKNCQKEIEPIGKRKNICPECKLFVKKEKEEEPEIEEEEIEKKKKEKAIGKEEAPKEEEYKIMAPKAINLSGKEMALAEILINAGLAKNLNDLTRKGLYVMSAMFNMPHAMEEQKQTKEQEEPDPRKAMKQVQEDEVMRAYIESLRGDKTSPAKTMKELQDQQLVEAYIKNMSKGNQTDPLQFMMLMRMMDNKSEGKENKDNNFMDKIMQLQMIKSLSGDNQVTALQREIADLKRDIQMQQLVQQSKGTPLQDQIMALEQIRASRDKEVKEMDVKLQIERDKNLSMAMETRVREIEKQIQQSGGSLNTQRLQEFREELKAIKEMSHELGEREKGAGEYISETIGNVANTLQPTLTRLIEQRERQREIQMQQPPAFPPQLENPQQQPQNLGPQEIQLIPSDMTETEKQMSDTMSDMYIKRKRE